MSLRRSKTNHSNVKRAALPNEAEQRRLPFRIVDLQLVSVVHDGIVSVSTTTMTKRLALATVKQLASQTYCAASRPCPYDCPCDAPRARACGQHQPKHRIVEPV